MNEFSVSFKLFKLFKSLPEIIQLLLPESKCPKFKVALAETPEIEILVSVSSLSATLVEIPESEITLLSLPAATTCDTSSNGASATGVMLTAMVCGAEEVSSEERGAGNVRSKLKLLSN